MKTRPAPEHAWRKGYDPKIAGEREHSASEIREAFENGKIAAGFKRVQVTGNPYHAGDELYLAWLRGFRLERSRHG